MPSTLPPFRANPRVLRHISHILKTRLRFYGNQVDVQSFDNLPDFSDDLYGASVQAHSPGGMDEQPCLVSVAGLFDYCVICYDSGRLLLGPVRLDTPIHCRFRLEWRDLGLPGDHRCAPEWISRVPVCGVDAWMDHVLLLFNHARDGEELTREALDAHNLARADAARNLPLSLSGLLFNSLEQGFVHNPFNHEMRECAAIEQGDVEELTRILSEDFTGRYGILSEDPVRQWINLGIVTVTIASRAAIRGGLHPETAFSLSDLAIQQMDRCDDIATIQYTFRQAELHYARMVREHRASQARGTQSAQNPHVAHAIDYVYTHIHDRITVQDIADSIGLEPNYLSMLFHKCEKIPLKQYIQEEKIKWVKNLLVDSDYPYIDIAAYLGFASQSHMGQVFKKITGLTPRQYRERYRKDDFMAEHQM